jgi:hypothetical protein
MARHYERFATPQLDITGDWQSWSFGSPYREEDLDHWQALLFEAFGTRSISTASVFLRQLSNLVGNGWNPDEQAWRPHLEELNTAIGIVASTQPENEMQAAMAAQMVALHFTAMALARRCGQTGYPDERTAATLARVSKAYGGLARTMAQLQGKATRHEQHFHYHDERHVHLGGGPNSGGQGHAIKEIDVDSQSSDCRDAGCAALPRLRPNDRQLLPIASGEGQASVPDAWWGQRIWSALWRGQRLVQARRLDA